MKKIALLCLVHKSPDQLMRLLKRIDDERFDFFIHMDQKSDIKPFLSSVKPLKASHIHWVKNRVKTYFNDFSLVTATYNTMKEAYSDDYQYYVLLTGQDYPIKDNNYMYNILTASYPTAFIDMYGVDEALRTGIKWVGNIGVSYFSQNIRRRLQQLLGSKLYHSSVGKPVKIIPKVYDKLMTWLKYSPGARIKQTKYTYSAGSHFWMLPDTAVHHILNVYQCDALINDVFHHVAAPEESYFQTALSSMPGLKLPENMLRQFDNTRSEMDNPALRLIKWYENGKHTNGHPAIWKMDDAEFIDNAEALFARKFDIAADNLILDHLDRICFSKPL